MIYSLLIIVMIILLATIYIFHSDLTSPAFLLTVAFMLAVSCCCLYANEWKFHDYRLIAVVVSGLLGFVVFSAITYMYDMNGKKTKKIQLVPVEIHSLKLCIYLLFQVALYTYYSYILLKNIGTFSIAFFSNAIGASYEAGKGYGSALINIGNIVNMPGIYYIIYVAVNNLVCKKKNHRAVYLNILVGMFGALLSGTRTTLFMYIIAIIVLYIILKQRQNGWTKNINIKNVIKGCLVLAILILLFNILFTLQGRKVSDLTVVDLLANYLGAPIKNLELFILDGKVKTNAVGTITFSDTYSWINKFHGKNEISIPSVYKYRWVNGKILGNVYTQFMPLYNDFGIAGTFFIMGLLGWLCQKVYDKIKLCNRNMQVDFCLLIYSYMSFAIIFCFFSNKFFELIIARAMIYFVVGIIAFDIFFRKLHIRGKSLVIMLDKKK